MKAAWDSGLLPSNRLTVGTALTRHTSELASLVVPLDQANAALIRDVTEACKNERDHSGNFWPCTHALTQLYRETNGNADESRAFLESLGIVPPIAMDYLAPENSLRQKSDLITDQALCNAWYSEMERNDCN